MFNQILLILIEVETVKDCYIVLTYINGMWRGALLQWTAFVPKLSLFLLQNEFGEEKINYLSQDSF